MPSPGLSAQQRRAKEAKFGPGPETSDAEDRKNLRLLKRARKAKIAQDSFKDFIEFTTPDFDDPSDPDKSGYTVKKHHAALIAACEEVVYGRIPVLIVVMPPRHGKSFVVSEKLPAWFMGKFPNRSVGVGTYNDDFAMDFGDAVRNVFKSAPFRQVFPKFALAKGGNAKDRLKTTERGQANFLGVGGSFTGRGAHLLVIDDLFKDYEQARSKTYRDRAWNWFTKVAMARRMGNKSVVITFTRWHSDDIIGRLTDPENEHYDAELASTIRIIKFPALAEPDDILGRKEGEALWPEQYDRAFLRQMQRLDPLGFEALYQQNPSLAEGSEFSRDDVRYYEQGAEPEGMRYYCTSDHAVSSAQRADLSCFLRFGVTDNGDIYLTNCIWKKMSADVAVENMLAMGTSEPGVLNWFAEKGHIAQSIGPFLKKRMHETGKYFRVTEITPSADKVQRAQSSAARHAMGKIFFPKGAPWTERAIAQMMEFPNGTHDDFVDALSLIGIGLGALVGGKEKEVAAPPKTGTLAWLKAQMKAEAAGGAQSAGEW